MLPATGRAVASVWRAILLQEGSVGSRLQEISVGSRLRLSTTAIHATSGGGQQQLRSQGSSWIQVWLAQKTTRNGQAVLSQHFL